MTDHQSYPDAVLSRVSMLQAKEAKAKLEQALYDMLSEYMDNTGTKIMEVHMQWDATTVATIDDPTAMTLTLLGVKLTVEL